MTRSMVACLHCRAEMDSTALLCASCRTPRGQGGSVTSVGLQQLEAWLRAVPDDRLPATIVRTYGANSQSDAARGLAAEAGILATRGYQPSAQSWAAGGASAGAYVVAGISDSRGRGSLTVTLVRNIVPAASPGRPTKRCPDCAEDVLAEARICRFCRHEFDSADT